METDESSVSDKNENKNRNSHILVSIGLNGSTIDEITTTTHEPDIDEDQTSDKRVLLIDSRNNCDNTTSTDACNKNSILNSNDLAIGFADDDDDLPDASEINATNCGFNLIDDDDDDDRINQPKTECG